MKVSLATRNITIVAALLASACASRAPGPNGGSVAIHQGGRVIVGDVLDAKTMNPLLSSDPGTALATASIYESLVKGNAKDGQIEPRLAERFELAADGKSLTFVLRDGLLWSDGSPFSGDDFTFTIEAVMRSKETAFKSRVAGITGARAYAAGKAETISGISTSGNQITVRLDEPFCPALGAIGGLPIIPRSVFGKYMDPKDPGKNIDAAPENAAPPLSMGPFKFKEWVPNDHSTVIRNDYFYGGKPYLDEWVHKVFPGGGAAAALQTGEVDVAEITSPELADELRRSDDLQLYTVLSSAEQYIGWNELRGGKEFFQSQPVRQALAYGLDMALFIDKVLQGQATRLIAHATPLSAGYDDSGLERYPYDPQRAHELLRKDGWSRGGDGVYQKGGQRLEFTLIAPAEGAVNARLAQFAAEQYRQFGVAMTVKTEAREALTDRVFRSKDAIYGDRGGHDFDAVIYSHPLGADPDSYLFWHSSQAREGRNHVGYHSEIADKALVDGRTRCAPEERQTAYRSLPRPLNLDQPVIGFSSQRMIFASKRVQGVDPGTFPSPPQGLVWNIVQWSVQR